MLYEKKAIFHFGVEIPFCTIKSVLMAVLILVWRNVLYWFWKPQSAFFIFTNRQNSSNFEIQIKMSNFCQMYLVCASLHIITMFENYRKTLDKKKKIKRELMNTGYGAALFTDSTAKR